MGHGNVLLPRRSYRVEFPLFLPPSLRGRCVGFIQSTDIDGFGFGFVLHLDFGWVLSIGFPQSARKRTRWRGTVPFQQQKRRQLFRFEIAMIGFPFFSSFGEVYKHILKSSESKAFFHSARNQMCYVYAMDRYCVYRDEHQIYIHSKSSENASAVIEYVIHSTPVLHICVHCTTISQCDR